MQATLYVVPVAQILPGALVDQLLTLSRVETWESIQVEGNILTAAMILAFQRQWGNNAIRTVAFADYY